MLYTIEEKKELEAAARHLGLADRLFWGIRSCAII